MKKNPKNPLIYECKICDFNTSNKKDYNRHLGTAKHIFLMNPNEKNPKKPQKYYKCNCGKEYKHSSSLCAHRKKCFGNIHADNNSSVDPSLNDLKTMTGMMIELFKNNNDFQKQVLEICKNNNISNFHNTNNSHNNNKTFNLQFFLNEECKDAMNLSDFVNSIQLKLSDLENIGKIGYVDGISDIMIKGLNEIELNKRPVHCSDAKRETLYVKQENKWEKDTEETKQMFKAVRDVDKKASILLMSEWKDANPELTNSKSNQNKQFIKLVGEVNDGDEANVKKVIKKVAKQVVIDK